MTLGMLRTAWVQHVRVRVPVRKTTYHFEGALGVMFVQALGKVTTECVDSVERLCNKNTYHGGCTAV